jgi:hypothetical protein
MGALEYRLRELVDGFPMGWALVAAMTLALVLCLGMLVALLRRRRELGWLVAVLVALGIVFVVAGAGLYVAQSLILKFVDAPASVVVDPSQRARLVATAVSQALLVVYFTGHVLLMVMPIVALALWRTRPSALWQRLFAAAVPVVMVVGWAALGWAKFAVSSWGGCADPQDRARIAWETLVEAREALRTGNAVLWGLGGISALGLALLAFRDARRGRIAPRRSVVASTTLLLVGIVAAASSRGRAHDGAHLLAPLGGECPLGQLPISELPRGPAGTLREDLPTLELWQGRTTLDGLTLSSPEELEKILVSKRELWRALHPTERRRLHTVRAAARRQERVAGMQPWISAARRAGFDEVALLHRNTPDVMARTATLGAVIRRRCGEAYRSLDADMPLAPSFEDWTQLAAVRPRAGSTSSRRAE